MQRAQAFFISLLIAILVLPTTMTAVIAQDKQIQQQRLPASVGSMPARGMSMDEVIQHFGQPVQRSAPVGNPPITRWIYDGMSVYFEHQYVIHAVAIDDSDHE